MMLVCLRLFRVLVSNDGSIRVLLTTYFLSPLPCGVMKKQNVDARSLEAVWVPVSSDRSNNVLLTTLFLFLLLFLSLSVSVG